MTVLPAVRALAVAGALILWLAGAATAQTLVPRVVVALVDAGEAVPLREVRSHQLATMPLEHLGLVVEYHRLADGLPEIVDRPEVRGVLTWFTESARPGALDLLEWMERVVDSGRKLVILGQLGVEADTELGTLPAARIDRFLERLGVRHAGAPVTFPAGAGYLELDPEYWGFEHVPPLPPPFPVLELSSASATAHVEVGWTGPSGPRSAVVVTGPAGGLVAPGYAAQIDGIKGIRRWLINPFAFLSRAFATDDLPKPDTTTIAGRRLFYSHVDGDGWRSVSELELAGRPASAAQVLLNHVLRRFDDLPTTIAPIAAETDPAWIDDSTARATVAEVMSLPHVEAGSHTYSHPFQWSFFEDYDAGAEQRILERFGLATLSGRRYEVAGSEMIVRDRPVPDGDSKGGPADAGAEGLDERYQIPRAFHARRFDLDLEVAGSIRRIEQVGGAPVRLYQWSGDTAPYEAAIAAVGRAGIPNINGGDTRLDSEFPSYGFVAPISLPVGRERQVYASMSNENTYTDLWSGRFFGFRHLLQTIERTGSPIRVKPINVYYHTYSAERVASLGALLQVLEDVRTRDIAPVTASRFAAIAQDFYRTRLVSVAPNRWRVEDRGALQTIRFDRATTRAVDFRNSVGVVGERPLQGSLYVALDPAHAAPEVALVDRADLLEPAPADHPYLADSRWPVSDLIAANGSVTVRAQGFGPLEMTWIVPDAGQWRVRVLQGGEEVASVASTVDDGRRLRVAELPDVEALTPSVLIIERAEP